MNIFGFGFYKPTSLKDFVMKIVGEKVVNSGTGKIFLVSPRASFVSVPTAERTVSFDFTELTSDSQSLNVQGVISVVLIPSQVAVEHDFTIDVLKNGTYIYPRVLAELQDKIVKMVQLIVRAKVQEKALKEHMKDVASLTDVIPAAVIGKAKDFEALGVTLNRVFVDKVAPGNSGISGALEATERENILTTADEAVAARRMQSARDDRSLREYEAETALNMEEQRSLLVDKQNTNLLKVAEANAEAKKKELAAYEGMDPGTIFALALNKFAERGVGTLNITPDMLEAMKSATGTKPSGRR